MSNILVVDDHAPNRDLLVTLLGYKGHRVLEADDGAAALELVRTEHPDLVISDILMPQMDGYQFVRNLRAATDIQQPRVIFVSAAYVDAEARALAHGCGVGHFLLKPIDPPTLLATVERVLAGPEDEVEEPGLGDKTLNRRYSQLLNKKLYEQIAQLENMNAQLDRRVANRTAELEAAKSALEAEVARRRDAETALREANIQLSEQAVRDPLTGLYNRRYLAESLERELSRSRRRGNLLAILMLDIDHFKRCNDTYGHAAGDAVLATVGRHIQSFARAEDIVCRYGGEEFVWVMTHTSTPAIQARAQALLESVQKIRVRDGDRKIGPVTVSAGIAVYPGHGTSGAQLLKAADAALYRAKDSGRNRAVMADAGTR